MTTPFNLPVPKIGNHPVECPCGTCANARKRLASSPYVQLLQRELIAAHKRLGEDSRSAPDLAVEHEVLRLRDQLDKIQDGQRVLTNTLTESRKINQERDAQLRSSEAQLGKVQTALRTAEDKLNICQVQLRNASEENKTLSYSVESLKSLQSLTADELGAAQAEVQRMEKEIRVVIALQNQNRSLADEIERLALELSSVNDLLSEERRAYAIENDASRGGMLVTLCAGMFLAAVVAYLIGRWAR